ncbi:hypothetical protein ACFELO_00460 [Oceanicaulis sp. LC35]|uniref:hypothetical protein n=1 Tax=Oceanicaulis sp. LC35 TaxID=3349635 RepID=UPI003F878B12
MKDASQFERLFLGAGDAAGPGAGAAPPVPVEASSAGPRANLFDAVLGLAVRAVLIVQMWSWSRANAALVDDPLSWRSWVTPTDGLETAARIWTMGQVDAGFAAVLLLTAATLASLSLAAGVLTRLTGIAILLGALWHILFILPEAFTSTVAYLALGLYLILRGAGPLSLDWALARLARLA